MPSTVLGRWRAVPQTTQCGPAFRTEAARYASGQPASAVAGASQVGERLVGCVPTWIVVPFQEVARIGGNSVSTSRSAD